MSIADELQKLDKLRREGALSDEEFEVAKYKVLETTDSAVDLDHLSEIKSQNELAQLDREWTIERENYMISGENGLRQIPTRTTSVIGGLLIVGFGLFWTITAGSKTGGLFPLFG